MIYIYLLNETAMYASVQARYDPISLKNNFIFYIYSLFLSRFTYCTVYRSGRSVPRLSSLGSSSFAFALNI